MMVAAQEVRPLVAWSPSKREALAARVFEWVSAWHSDWGIACDVAPKVQSASRVVPTGVHWHFQGHARGPVTSAGVQLVSDTLWGQTHSRLNGNGSEITNDIAQEAWADWLARGQSLWGCPLLPADDGLSAISLSTFSTDWSGAVRIAFDFCARPMSLWVSGDLATTLLMAAELSDRCSERAILPPLSDVSQAIGRTLLQVRAELSSVSLTLGELHSLALDDVIVLPHPVRRPVQMKGPDNSPLCSAWLGMQTGRIAVELVKTPVAR